MSLLTELTTHAVDEGYAQAALRRSSIADVSATSAPRGGSARVTAIFAAVVLAAAGTLFATSAIATHRHADASRRARTDLLNQIHVRTKDADHLQTQLNDLRARVTSARDDALSATGRGSQLQREIEELEVAAGALAVEGGGVEVTLDNAISSSNPGAGSLGVIFDRDLQAIVDALFANGAEAIAINGQRLTTRTAIREAGDAILVDYRPLTPPYHVDAIGPSSLSAEFLRSPTGTLYENWRQVYGLGFTVVSRARITLPSADTQVVRYAEPLSSSSAIPSPSEPSLESP